MAEDKGTIAKLSGKNWQSWKLKMTHFLRSKKVWGVVDGSCPRPGNNATNAERDSYQDKEDQALSTIILALSDDLTYLVTNCDTPKKTWDTLKKHFEKSSLMNKFYLRKSYFKMEKKEDCTMSDHIKGMKELSDQLAAIGDVQSEGDKVCTLLGSLPPSFDNFVTAFATHLDSTDLDSLQEALLHEERKKKSNESTESDTALLGNQNEKKKPPIVCYGCGREGHIRRDCERKYKHKSKLSKKRKSQMNYCFQLLNWILRSQIAGLWTLELQVT